ncbi:hypothetical protein BD626DRAFT_523822 [Schizophyllum amplum]|uniref:BTB domain-containing protein n=1 Tax=Schizophyllum amplum TaxID=97359 RepID=A0A550BSU0_9AGAR|nr:hypothetical protein BD626DRAFT_523822 [Auriculariopsis ampla]
MTDANAAPDAAPQQDRQSSDFSSTDGEIIVFRSSDGVLFNIHRRNLQSVTSGPFAEDFDAPAGEIVPLTEDKDTLRTLFAFVYPNPHPLLCDTSFEKLMQVAEAGEKYKVAPAISVCQLNMRLSMLYKKHPLEIIQFADRHGYTELLDLSAPYTLELKLRMRDARRILSLPVFAAWAEYCQARRDILSLETYNKRMCAVHSNGLLCLSWHSVVYMVEERWTERGMSSSEDVDYIFRADGLPDCRALSYYNGATNSRHTYCQDQLEEWKGAVKERFLAMHPLSTYLTCPA